MNRRDKIALWADENLNGLYWHKPGLKSDVLQKFYNLFIPVCSHTDFETGAHCNQKGEPCWMPMLGYDNESEEIKWVCYKHMHIEGFCSNCRQLWAGVEDFDFDPRGLCSNCRDTGRDYWDEDYETDGYYDETFYP